MGYCEVSIVVDGALDSVFHVSESSVLQEKVTETEIEARESGYPTEMFYIWHEHDDNGEDCECVQYLTDHKPAHSFNVA